MTEQVRGRDICSVCGLKRYGRMPYCPKCGTKYEIDIPLKNHPATYKRCKDCKWFRYHKEGEINWNPETYGTCECKREFRKFTGNTFRGTYSYGTTDKDSGYRSHTTKACKHFEEKE